MFVFYLQWKEDKLFVYCCWENKPNKITQIWIKSTSLLIKNEHKTDKKY